MLYVAFCKIKPGLTAGSPEIILLRRLRSEWYCGAPNNIRQQGNGPH